MTLEQLRIFALVAERGHMTHAAEVLGISQSGASAAIKALESLHGVTLFNRVGRRIELSESGKRFLPEAKSVLARSEAARLVLRNIAETVSGSVAIAASQTIASYWLPQRLAGFREKYGAVRLDLTVGNTRYVEAAVLEGTAEIGLVEGRTRADLLERSRVDIDRLLLVTGRDMPPPPELSPGVPDISAIRWIVRERGSGTREALEDLAVRQGVAFEDVPIFLVLPTNEAVRRAVEAGAGATIISEHVVARGVADGSLRHVPLDIPPRDFALIVHTAREPGPAQQALIRHLKA
ncbi:MAG: LysR family transcriptional regulator [Rhizobiaceae bacterium]|nr:LysR family transcriptional regulator [Rhizobiaceae bacterium]